MADKKNDDLETVRVLADALAPFTEEERERIIRWSREKLGMPAPQVSLSSHSVPVMPSSMESTPPPNNLGPKNIKSFIQEKNPRSDVQFAAVAAYFYRFEASVNERKETIGAKDLQDAGRQARGYGFTDALKTLSNGLSLGYFDRAGRGTFMLNAVGENLVAMVLPGGIDEGGSSRKSNQRKKPAKTKKAKGAKK